MRNNDKKTQLARAKTLMTGLAFNESTYEYDDKFVPADLSDPLQVHTTAELAAYLEKDKSAELDAKVLGSSSGRTSVRSLERDAFLGGYKNSKLKESFDSFAVDIEDYNTSAGLIGEDFTPYLGGPFYKNLYFYQDYIRMHSAAFYAYHHDPIANATVCITRDFTLGRGFRMDSDNKAAMALWDAFCDANDINALMWDFATELSIYGEQMLWWLPNNETKITYRLGPSDKIPVGLIPRVRLIDPSNIIEIVTYPEDMTRRLFYVWLAPTQYQIYTGAGNQAPDKVQPTLKFIYRQIPADQIMHFKINGVSNEKRGRSDLFSVLGYMKRLRDSVNYSIITLQKQAAWGIDTEVDGSQSDIDAYVNDQQQYGSIAPAGSEFVHSTKIKRQFLANVGGRAGSHDAFSWALSMISAGTQIPMNYFGTHLSGGQTRASAIVATEPVAKKFEQRQQVYKRLIQKMWDRLMQDCGLGYVECEITFPEIITQDRSAKLKDLALAQTQGWISEERAAQIAAKELGIMEFDYAQETAKIKADIVPAGGSPLTSPGMASGSNGALSGDERREIKQQNA